MATRHELIGPDIIYTSPYTGLPTTDPKNSSSAYYAHIESPHVSWGYKKNNQVLWVESEWNLEGTATIIPHLSMVAGKLVTMKGFGASLSGDWWISTVTHTVDTQSGYTMQMDLMRNAMGDKDTPPKPAAQNPTRPPASTVTPNSSSGKTYTVKRGDNLWNIARKYYGKGSLYTKIFQANKDKIKNANLIYPGQVLIIP
jgi:LysM repeat protein